MHRLPARAGDDVTAVSRWRAAFAVAFAVSLYVLLAPADDTPSLFPRLDKVVHVLVFAAVAFTGRRAGVPAGRLVVGLVCYAVLTEIVQGLDLLDRSRDPWDVVADAVGIAVGVAVAGGGRGPSEARRGSLSDLPG